MNSDLLFVSDSLCLQSSVFNAVPWVLAVSINVSSLCILASWQAYNLKNRQYTLAIHMLVFHFCLNIACVVEFRTDGTASVHDYANVVILRVFGTRDDGYRVCVCFVVPARGRA
jgi:hypothetical protein